MLQRIGHIARRHVARAGFLVCVGALIAAPAVAQSSPPLLSGLVAWWSGENNANDSVGPSNGTIVGTVAYGAGKLGQAFNFTGAGRVSIAAPPSSTAFTIDACVFVNNATDASGYKTIYSDDARGFWLLGGKISWWGPGGNKLTGVGTIAYGQWNHVAITYSATGVMISYLNGGQDFVKSGVGGQALPNGSGAGVGGHNYAPEHFRGLIDEVRVFNRVLSGGEIAALRNWTCP